jgi:hypothetical protein
MNTGYLQHHAMARNKQQYFAKQRTKNGAERICQTVWNKACHIGCNYSLFWTRTVQQEPTPAIRDIVDCPHQTLAAALVVDVAKLGSEVVDLISVHRAGEPVHSFWSAWSPWQQAHSLALHAYESDGFERKPIESHGAAIETGGCCVRLAGNSRRAKQVRCVVHILG